MLLSFCGRLGNSVLKGHVIRAMLLTLAARCISCEHWRGRNDHRQYRILFIGLEEVLEPWLMAFIEQPLLLSYGELLSRSTRSSNVELQNYSKQYDASR